MYNNGLINLDVKAFENTLNLVVLPWTMPKWRQKIQRKMNDPWWFITLDNSAFSIMFYVYCHSTECARLQKILCFKYSLARPLFYSALKCHDQVVDVNANHDKIFSRYVSCHMKI